jgi:hypothetical protein
MDVGGKASQKRPPRRPRDKWVDNIKMNLTEVGSGGMDWINLAQDRDQYSNEPSGSRKY